MVTLVTVFAERIDEAHKLLVQLIASNFIGERRVTGVLVHLQQIYNVVFARKVRTNWQLTLLGFLCFLGLLARGAPG